MKLWKRALSATISPPKPMTNVRPPKSCTYGATWRNQRTKLSELCMLVIFSNCSGEPRGELRSEPIYCLARYAVTMKLIRALSLTLLLAPALPAAAEEPSSTTLNHALTLVHMFVRIAAEGDSSTASLRAIDEVLAGRNAAANEAVAGLMKDMLADVSP